jgi:hypothetical protein
VLLSSPRSGLVLRPLAAADAPELRRILRGDGGIPCGNHHAIALSQAKEVNALDRAERVPYEKLLKPEGITRRIVLRAPAADYAAIRLAAARTGTSMQEWLLGVAREAAKEGMN